MPSRQERRKAERDAAKRAPANTGGAGAATARAPVVPLGNWKTQTANPSLLLTALGAKILKERADEGDGQGLIVHSFTVQLNLSRV